MRHVLGLFGLLAASALVVVSAAMNWRFGFSLGKTEFDGQVYGLASVAADCLKAIVPFLIIYAWKTRKWAQALAGVALAIICTGYSITSSIGFAAVNRADNTGQRMIEASNYKDVRAELKRLEDKLSWMPKHRPANAVIADLERVKSTQVKMRGKKRSTVEALTNDCSITNWVSRKYCSEVFNFKKELAISLEAVKIDQRIRVLRDKMSRATSEAAAGKADPQADLIASIFGLKLEDTQTVLILLVSLLVEAGSALGYFVVFSMWRLDPRKAMNEIAYEDNRAMAIAVKQTDQQAGLVANGSEVTSSVEDQGLIEAAGVSEEERSIKEALQNDNDNHNEILEVASGNTQSIEILDPVRLPKNEMDRYYEDRIVEAEGQSTTATELYDDYCAWCIEQSSNPMSQIPFGKKLSQRKIKKAKIAGRIRYKGIKLKHGAFDAKGRQTLAAKMIEKQENGREVKGAGVKISATKVA